jgi:hypothetical protein
MAVSNLEQCRRSAMLFAKHGRITADKLGDWLDACEKLYATPLTMDERIWCLWHKLAALLRGDRMVFCRIVRGEPPS